MVDEEGATEESDENVVGVRIGRTTPWITLQLVEGLEAAIHKATVHVGGHEGIVECLVGAVGAGGVGEDVGRGGGVAGAAGKRDGDDKLGERGRRRKRAAKRKDREAEVGLGAEEGKELEGGERRDCEEGGE